jgi:hypothetical protein
MDSAAGVLPVLGPPLPSYDLILSPPPYTYVNAVPILIHTGKGGRANQREGKRGNSSQCQSKIQT